MRKAETGDISVVHLSVSFERWGQSVRALDDVTFNVSSGEWLLVVGSNGAGKSTLLKALAGYLRPDAGEVRVSSHLVYNLRPGQLARTVYLVHQDPLLGSASLLSVFENLFVADPLAAHDSKSSLRTRYREILSPLGLDQRLDQLVKLLSGGERQLLAMTIATLRDARVILLDEPLAALDPTKAGLCIGQIQQMHRDGKTVVQIAHETREIAPLASRLLTLGEGRIVADEKLRAVELTSD